MTTQEKNKAIAEWLGFDLKKAYFIPTDWQPDKNRNQQKLIEDKLIELEYRIKYEYRKAQKIWLVIIYNVDKDVMKINKSKDIAFIDAIIELIQSK